MPVRRRPLIICFGTWNTEYRAFSSSSFDPVPVVSAPAAAAPPAPPPPSGSDCDDSPKQESSSTSNVDSPSAGSVASALTSLKKFVVATYSNSRRHLNSNHNGDGVHGKNNDVSYPAFHALRSGGLESPKTPLRRAINFSSAPLEDIKGSKQYYCRRATAAPASRSRTDIRDASPSSSSSSSIVSSSAAAAAAAVPPHLSRRPSQLSLSRAPPEKKGRRSSRTSLENAASEYREPLSDWLKPGADMYVISLQEILSASAVYEGIRQYLNRVHRPREYLLARTKSTEIVGRGDGAYIRSKRTALAIFVAADCLGPLATQIPPKRRGSAAAADAPAAVIPDAAPAPSVILGSSHGVVVGRGSKGAVGAVATIYGQPVCFVGGHLPASSAAVRVRARRKITQELRAALPEDLQHIIWGGDFNARLQSVKSEEAMELLAADRLSSLRQYDEWEYVEFAGGFDGFKEAPITFYPTYKRVAHRPPLKESIRTEGVWWPHSQYVRTYRQRWYKGARIKSAVPSWCDRIVVWSKPHSEKLLTCLKDSYIACEPDAPSVMLTSDHNAVACSFALSFPPENFSITASATDGTFGKGGGAGD